MQTKTRDFRFDALRTIGLFAIIFAHVNPPAGLFQLRNFDVPLMVLLMGSVYTLSSARNLSYLKYLYHRVFRLYVPTAIFLIFFFLIKLMIANFSGTTFPYSRSVILSSFELTTGIGYVWIIRVFILIALIMPLLLNLYQKIGSKKFLCTLFFIYITYEIISRVYPGSGLSDYALVDQIFKNIIFYLLPFGCVAGLGLAIKDLDRKVLIKLATFFGLIFITSALYYLNTTGHFIPTQSAKYPPHIYYLSYALFISILLYLSSLTKTFAKIFDNRFVVFIGTASLWIYLWQILFLSLWRVAKTNFDPHYSYLIEFILVSVLSLAIVWIQRRLVGFITNNGKSDTKMNKIIARIFLN